MHTKFTLQWTLTFTTLLLFSTFTIANVTGGTSQAAYAQAIKSSSGNWAAYPAFIVVEADAVKKSPLLKVFERLSKNTSREKELCALTANQYRAVAAAVELSTQTLVFQKATIVLAEAATGAFGRKDLLAVLARAAAGTPECAPFGIYQQIILLLGGHLS